MSTIDSKQLDRLGGFGDLLIALGLSLGPVVALGFSRFAYALLLPAMRADLHWNYFQAGAANTANAVGYIVGAITAASPSKRFGARDVFVGSLLVSAIALILSGYTRIIGHCSRSGSSAGTPRR
jgi:predicted MFS family arabinose efflux permease